MIREKSKTSVLEYESPDGDKWEITIAEHENRKYVQYRQVESGPNNPQMADSRPITIDGEMLLDMADAYRNAISKHSVAFKGVNKSAIAAPRIVDHRKTVEEAGADIQAKVDETMQNHDQEAPPVQSLSKTDSYAEFRTGLSPDVATQAPEETPEEWALRNKEAADLSNWQKEALERREKLRPAVQGKAGGYERPNFKQVEAKDII